MEGEHPPEFESKRKLGLYELLFDKNYTAEDIKALNLLIPVANIRDKVELLREFYPDSLLPDASGNVETRIFDTTMVTIYDAETKLYFFIVEEDKTAERQ